MMGSIIYNLLLSFIYKTNLNRLICVVLLLSSFALNAQTKSDTIYKEKKYPNGNLMYKGYFLNRRPVGEFLRYYPNGIIKAKMNYSPNSVYARLFNEKGKLVACGKYTGKKKDSTWIYYRNSIIIGREDYKQGVVEGVVNKYFVNGKIADSQCWKDGKKNGAWMRYYRNGKIKCKGIYKNGKLNGKFNAYKSSGIMDIEGYFINNLREGTWCFYGSDGKFQFKVDYKKGVPLNNKEIERLEKDNVLRLRKSDHNFVDPQDYINSPEEYLIKSKRNGKK